MTQNIIWKSGEWTSPELAQISIKDRGLKFSDGIFETILIKNNQAILLNEHLARLDKTLQILEFQFNLDQNLISDIIKEGIKKLETNNNEFGAIRINYSRGINQTRSIKINPEYSTFNLNNLWIEFYRIKLNFIPITAFISKKEKRNEYSSLSQCKTFSYAQSIQTLIEANNNNFDDSLILNTRNELCCGSTFNIILKRDNRWYTPRKESGCLPGIMVNQLHKLGLVEERNLLPEFNKDDILIAINSLSCRQISKVNEVKFTTVFDTKYFWNLIYN